ncbi:GTPase-activating protein gyp10 [Cryomyces antarcticus]
MDDGLGNPSANEPKDEHVAASPIAEKVPAASPRAAVDRELSSGKPLSASWRPEPLSEAEGSKVVQILEACRNRDVEALAALATSRHGLVEDEIRRAAWPVLLGCSSDAYKQQPPWQSLPPHKDEDQVRLDVNRSFVYYPSNESEKQIDHRKQELSNLITEVLRRHPSLCYFQGYHDIVQVLLLVLGADKGAPSVAHLSLLRIRDFMLPALSAAIAHLKLLPSILYAQDSELCRHLSHTEPFFALAATLTLYAHDIEEYGDIARLFDFLLAREAVMSVYLFAVVVMSRKTELLEIEPDEPEMLHSVLSKLPKPLDLEALIASTVNLFNSHPPESLPNRAWRNISSYSVLKTTRTPTQLITQTLEYGEEMFAKQAAQMRRAERRDHLRKEAGRLANKYKRPAGALGLAVAVAVLSWWMRRNGVASSAYAMAGPFRDAWTRVASSVRTVF